MKIPQNLPVTPLQSKAARYQLGLTQASVIDESGLPGHKLKGFETGRLIPDMKFLEALSNFYKGKGIDLSELKDGDGLMPVTAAAVAPKPGSQMVQPVYQMAFRISAAPDQVDALLEQMEAQDERIAAILKEPAKSGFLSDYDETTDALQRELFGLMAANYMYFRVLQGRSLIAPEPKASEQKTQLDLFIGWLKTTTLASLLDTNAAAAESIHEEEEA